MRHIHVVALLGFTALCGLRAAAQGVPPLLPQQPPPAVNSAAARALNDAYTALNRAMVLDPGAATRADFAYQSALARLRMGDVAGALADAARAQGLAGAAPPLAPAVSRALTFPPSQTSAGLRSGAAQVQALSAAPLPPYIITARDAVLKAANCGADTRKASAHLRDAIDAYVSGDAARARSEARSANDATSRSSALASGCRHTRRTS